MAYEVVKGTTFRAVCTHGDRPYRIWREGPPAPDGAGAFFRFKGRGAPYSPQIPYDSLAQLVGRMVDSGGGELLQLLERARQLTPTCGTAYVLTVTPARSS